MLHTAWHSPASDSLWAPDGSGGSGSGSGSAGGGRGAGGNRGKQRRKGAGKRSGKGNGRKVGVLWSSGCPATPLTCVDSKLPPVLMPHVSGVMTRRQNLCMFVCIICQSSGGYSDSMASKRSPRAGGAGFRDMAYLNKPKYKFEEGEFNPRAANEERAKNAESHLYYSRKARPVAYKCVQFEPTSNTLVCRQCCAVCVCVCSVSVIVCSMQCAMCIVCDYLRVAHTFVSAHDRPRTLQEYKQQNPKKYVQLGTLGPDLNSDELVAKVSPPTSLHTQHLLYAPAHTPCPHALVCLLWHTLSHSARTSNVSRSFLGS